ncbi:hypothetical protein GH733_006573 [Mirounga leonina]|nr:hypothetical protein GH733_006573 [Mirounga leonina]
MFNTSSLLKQLNEQFTWVSQLANLTQSEDPVYLQVVAKLFDSDFITVMVPKVSRYNHKFMETVAEKALQEYHKKNWENEIVPCNWHAKSNEGHLSISNYARFVPEVSDEEYCGLLVEHMLKVMKEQTIYKHQNLEEVWEEKQSLERGWGMDILKEGPKENDDVIQRNVSLPLQVLRQVIVGDTFASEDMKSTTQGTTLRQQDFHEVNKRRTFLQDNSWIKKCPKEEKDENYGRVVLNRRNSHDALDRKANERDEPKATISRYGSDDTLDRLQHHPKQGSKQKPSSPVPSPNQLRRENRSQDLENIVKVTTSLQKTNKGSKDLDNLIKVVPRTGKSMQGGQSLDSLIKVSPETNRTNQRNQDLDKLIRVNPETLTNNQSEGLDNLVKVKSSALRNPERASLPYKQLRGYAAMMHSGPTLTSQDRGYNAYQCEICKRPLENLQAGFICQCLVAKVIEHKCSRTVANQRAPGALL